MDKIKYALIAVSVFAVAAIAVMIFYSPAANKYDGFAKCLSENGAKMYGAYWCKHCESQKEIFSGSWQYVDYIECSLPNGGQNELCSNAGITAYPTWEFKNGERVQGELSYKQLSQYSGCAIP